MDFFTSKVEIIFVRSFFHPLEVEKKPPLPNKKMLPGKHRKVPFFLGNERIAGFRGFKLMEIDVATAVFHVIIKLLLRGSGYLVTVYM